MVSLSVSLPVHLSVCHSLCSVFVFSQSVCLSVHPTNTLAVLVSLCLFVSPSSCPSAFVSVCHPVSPSVDSSVCLTINLTFVPFVQLFVCMVFLEVNYDCSCLLYLFPVYNNYTTYRYVNSFPVKTS